MKERLIPNKTGRPGPPGSALIMVLWVLIILSIIIGSFAFDMHVEARVSSYYRKKLKVRYLAEAGIERAKLLLAQSLKVTEQQAAEETGAKEWYPISLQLKNGLRVHEESDLGDGTVQLDIVPEPARRNVNKLTDENWHDLLHEANVPESLRDELTACFLDWTDKNGDHRLNGAETDDYYSLLDHPYEARNGPLDTIEELKLIKGFTYEILYGGVPEDAPEDAEPMKGILQWLTTFGDGKVNVNAASFDVLMTLPLLDDLTVAEIILQRSGEDAVEGTEDDEPFPSIDDLFTRVPSVDKSLRKHLTVDAQKTYRITSVGRLGKETGLLVEHAVMCVMMVRSRKEPELLLWQE